MKPTDCVISRNRASRDTQKSPMPVPPMPLTELVIRSLISSGLRELLSRSLDSVVSVGELAKLSMTASASVASCVFVFWRC